MRPAKSTMPRRDRNIRGLYLADLLWPLQRLLNLRNPPFVADTEFTRFDLDALLHDDSQRASLSYNKATRYHVSEPGKRFNAEFSHPIASCRVALAFCKRYTTSGLTRSYLCPFRFALYRPRIDSLKRQAIWEPDLPLLTERID
jgi:hypothetical protein